LDGWIFFRPDGADLQCASRVAGRMAGGWWVTNGQWLEKMGGMTYRVADNKTAVAKKTN